MVGNSQVVFEKAENSSLTLVGKFCFMKTIVNVCLNLTHGNISYFSFCWQSGKAKTKEARQTIINPDWNFERMGIGGLDKEFSDIFRRAFASRVFPPDIVEQMGTVSLITFQQLL